MIRHCALVVALSVIACHPKHHAPVTEANAEQQALLAKLDGYLRCIDEFSPRVFEIADAYRDAVAGAPSPEPTVVATEDPESCLNTVVWSSYASPRWPEVEASAAAYADALNEIYDLTHASAAARAPRATLLAAFSEFDRAETDLFDRLYQINHEQRAKDIAERIAHDGVTLGTELDRVMLCGEELVLAAKTPSDALDQLDAGATNTRIDALEAAQLHLESYAMANAKEADEFKAQPAFVEATHELVLAGKQLVARAKDHLAYTDAERLMLTAHDAAHVVGSPAALAAAYNHLLDEYVLR